MTLGNRGCYPAATVFRSCAQRTIFVQKCIRRKRVLMKKSVLRFFVHLLLRWFFLFLCLLYFIGLATCQLDIVFPNGPFSKITTFSIMINGLQINYLQQQQQQGYLFFLSRWSRFAATDLLPLHSQLNFSKSPGSKKQNEMQITIFRLLTLPWKFNGLGEKKHSEYSSSGNVVGFFSKGGEPGIFCLFSLFQAVP